jgi:Ca2+-binding EF-hand superfamily protein
MTLQQLQNERWALLSMLDTDKDGRVSRAEWDAVSAIAPGQLTPAVWERLDANKDGYVARDEVNARIAARFALMDTNHDNLVSPEEMKALQAEAMRQPQAAQSATPPAPAPAPKPPAGPPPK